MPPCKCFMAMGGCPVDALKARVAALEHELADVQDWREWIDAWMEVYHPTIRKLWEREQEAGGPEPAAEIPPASCGSKADLQQHPSGNTVPGGAGSQHQQQRDSRPAPAQAAAPAQQPREGGGA